MLQRTRGIILRSIKYGETSLINTIFTEQFGVESFLIQGVRTAKIKQQRAGILQPACLLEMVVYYKPHNQLQKLREYNPAYIYSSIQEEVVKNSIALFSAELLLRLLPERAPLPELFGFCFDYFRMLDAFPADETANLPLYFIIQISKTMGYGLKGRYSEQTPYLHLQEGGFSEHPPVIRPFVKEEDARLLVRFLNAENYAGLKDVTLHSDTRFLLLDWYIEFLRQHTQHLSQIKSLSVLRAILH